MITQSAYQKYQRIFYQKVSNSNNNGKVVLTKSDTSTGTTFQKFTGTNPVGSVLYSAEVPCLYKRTISNKEREAKGISVDVTAVVYLSPLSFTSGFPIAENNFNEYLVGFFGQTYTIESIVELEPMSYNGVKLVFGYELRLKNLV